MHARLLGFKTYRPTFGPVGNSGNVDHLSNVGVSITYLTKPVKQQFIRAKFPSPSTIRFAFC